MTQYESSVENVSFQNIVTRLTDGQTPRVWSLLVTIFGELAQDEGAKISGLLLRHMREVIGIKPEAMRVALHRLRKDGWIENERKGRTSAHFLTQQGRAQSAAASPRIYASRSLRTQAWLVLCDPTQPHGHLDDAGLWLSSNMMVTTENTHHADTFQAPLNESANIPEWIKNKICDRETCAKSQAFAETLEAVGKDLTRIPPLSKLERAVLRILLVHAWRRILLKTPDLPDRLYPQDWYGPQCRAQMTSLLSQFPKLDLDELENAVLAD